MRLFDWLCKLRSPQYDQYACQQDVVKITALKADVYYQKTLLQDCAALYMSKPAAYVQFSGVPKPVPIGKQD